MGKLKGCTYEDSQTEMVCNWLPTLMILGSLSWQAMLRIERKILPARSSMTRMRSKSLSSEMRSTKRPCAKLTQPPTYKMDSIHRCHRYGPAWCFDHFDLRYGPARLRWRTRRKGSWTSSVMVAGEIWWYLSWQWHNGFTVTFDMALAQTVLIFATMCCTRYILSLDSPFL